MRKNEKLWDEFLAELNPDLLNTSEYGEETGP
jgi:hypothetical protein